MTQIDSSIGVLTPEGIEFVLYPAGPLVRACAYGIDSAFQGLVILGVAIFTSMFEVLSGLWFLLLTSFLLDWFYHVFWELCFRGQSPGKWIMGLRVVRSNGAPINPGASLLRNLMRFADTFMFLNLIALLSIIFSPAFRRIGDWAADTVVVYTAASQVPLAFLSLPWLSDLSAQTPSRALSYKEKQLILMFARRYPLLGKARGDEIAREFAASIHRSTEQPSPLSPAEYLLGLARSVGGEEVAGVNNANWRR
ncbi:hypothetical protein FACS1894200_05430 [Spirochaetia bacterium]|nr:hypothetical protein FACS1894200_05430 [Spirochaetia bacterium]